MLRRHAVTALLLTSVVLAWGCEAPPPEAGALQETLETAALPIAGGYETGGDDRAVVGLVMLGNQGMGVCSGSLIAPNVVLTARHCVAPLNDMTEYGGVMCGTTTFGPHYEPSHIFVTTNERIAQDSAYVAAQEIIVPEESNQVCGYDMALLVLEQPIPGVLAQPLTPRVDTPLVADTPFTLASGEEYSAIGYGATNDAGYGSGVRRRRDGLNVTCEGIDCQVYGAAATEWVGHTGVCQGDSGGPAVDLAGRVVGVASRGASGCQYPVYGYVFAWGDWIIEHVVAASEQVGMAPPRWATGWPTDPAYSAPIGGQCFDGTTCPSGRCVDGMCSRKCSEQAPCPAGFTCNADGLCAVVPVGGTCAGDEDCGGGICDEGVCTRECTALLACPEGFACSGGGLCESVEVGGACTVDADCGAGACFDGYCTRSCSEASPCPEAYWCAPQSGLCVLEPMGAECVLGADCPSGMCLGGLCTRSCDEETPCESGWTCDDEDRCALIPVSEGCATHDDCAGGGACVEGSCTRMCHAGAPCPEGWECSTGSGLCEQVASADPLGGGSEQPDAPGTDAAVSSGCEAGSPAGALGWLAALAILLGLTARRRAGWAVR